MNGLRESINPITQTLKVFLAISRPDVPDSPARHDEGQRKKPLGSRNSSIRDSIRGQLFLSANSTPC